MGTIADRQRRIHQVVGVVGAIINHTNGNTTMAAFSLSEALKTEALTPFGNALAGALGGVASNT
jgi:hypothetical protein